MINQKTKTILKKFGKAKVINQTNVFAHIDGVNSLMKNIAKILNKEGIFIVEVHYLVSLIKTLQYDTIYHEHMKYYSLTSLNYLFKKFNFRIFKSKRNPNSWWLKIHVTKNKAFKTDNSVKKILKFEKSI